MCGRKKKNSIQWKTDFCACNETKGTLSHTLPFPPVRIISSQRDLSAVRMIQLSRAEVVGGGRKHI